MTSSVLLATGVRDHLPDIPGLTECYGTTVHHCPYCDGWEVRGRTLAALSERASPAGLALSLLTWTDRVMVCTNGSASARPTSAQRRQLASHGIQIQHSRIARFDHQDGHLRHIVFEDGTVTSVRCGVLRRAAEPAVRAGPSSLAASSPTAAR